MVMFEEVSRWAGCRLAGTAIAGGGSDKFLDEPEAAVGEGELERFHGSWRLVGDRVINARKSYDGEGVPVDKLRAARVTVDARENWTCRFII